MIQNFISKLSPQERKIFYIAACFIILALVDRIFFGPLTSKLKSLDEDIEQEKNVIKRDLRFLMYKDKILKENEELSIYYSKAPKTEEEIIADFLKAVEILATEAKINLIKVSPSETKPKKGYVEYYADLECDGPLENVAKFIHSIDSSKDLLKIVKMDLAPKKASANEISAVMSVVKFVIDVSSIEEEEKLLAAAGGTSGGEGASGQDMSANAAAEAGGASSGAADASSKGVTGATEAAGSTRFPMKGLKDDKKEQPPPAGEVNEIKPSPWEKILHKKGVTPQEDAQEEVQE